MDQDMLPAYHAKGAADGYAKDVLDLNRVLKMLKARKLESHIISYEYRKSDQKTIKKDWEGLNGWFPRPGLDPAQFRPESGPCLSPSVADHPLRPATDHRLGKLLPHQLSNQTRAPLRADSSFCSLAYGVLAAVSSCCSPPKGSVHPDPGSNSP
ncbi:hypothetical protein CQW23_15990 [Capsicum baccatum]|uniref:Uncharacterized protein n=1 Tax=Capsicum baccatum TaxID=33114 RepID=A0A2G2WNN1_CAPBA|nr:hypothetical protein CQW23_15990 [Capsicum baccatum]